MLLARKARRLRGFCFSAEGFTSIHGYLSV